MTNSERPSWVDALGFDPTQPEGAAVLQELMSKCVQDGLTSTGIDFGLCGLPMSAHAGRCPDCGGYGEIERWDGPHACMPCVTGLGPHGHEFKAAQ